MENERSKSKGKDEKNKNAKQCLESGSVGSVTFWLPGSGSKGQNVNQKMKKNFSLFKLKPKLFKKKNHQNFSYCRFVRQV